MSLSSCPSCGQRTLGQSERSDFCTDDRCGYSFYYADSYSPGDSNHENPGSGWRPDRRRY